MPPGRQVAASDVNVVVINIADTDSAWSVNQEIFTSGAKNVDTAQHVVMAPDDSTVRLCSSAGKWGCARGVIYGAGVDLDRCGDHRRANGMR